MHCLDETVNRRLGVLISGRGSGLQALDQHPGADRRGREEDVRVIGQIKIVRGERPAVTYV